MLSALIWLPIVAATVLLCWPGTLSAAWAQRSAAIAAGAALAIAIALFFQFDPQIHDWQLLEQLPWIEQLGLGYRLGVDGLSLPLVGLNALLTFLIIAGLERQEQRSRLYYGLMLLLSGAVSGAFLAQDLLLFFVFYEVELIPLYLLISIWGGARRGYAATKFLIYTALSGALLLIGFLALTILSGAGSFAYNPNLAAVLPIAQQVTLLVLILVAFGIKTPIVPFHTWLPDAHVEASTPVSMMLAGVLLKLGTYGILRFGLGLFPQVWPIVAPWLAGLAVVSTLYGSLSAIVQQDMKKMVAYSSIGHMGYILLAAAAATPLSLLGAVCQMISHGLISALLFLEVGFVYSRTGTRDLRVLQGLLTPERGLPIVGSLMILAVMASGGLPGMVGFIAEFMIFRGSFSTFTVQTLFCMVGTGLTSVYFLLLVNRAFFGRLPDQMETLPNVALREHIPALMLATLIVIFGVQPQWLVVWTEPATAALGNLAVIASRALDALT
ncbi:NADH-quinone oxidoreductase subunit M [Synechococcus elongatus]|uniref:NADPH dehydrogenase subunit 4 n=1 Tax=Synechococcus elongatus (strain ATCC 33912 / PCC 7942 / FACHB-805) TaxID=1140 RepID=Q8VPU9_SYNE7|nr:NADH-quinone oxidoreductase subunit M [Synechococcus elongatus]AAK40244.1 NADPH dehydrogenase subunit 4 [Synechococcus elongatus PCC 7942 = FACHB-805]ABB56641.1 proton-translocating NADH-quinone oxidoreductase, chain M [Synechococcus elongatus PCC 7942 = FACHB-805]AJD58814.1 NAD(P)H-quinone oxidoreductase subunit D4 [Synechococcus elongatus UTEX 2973]MBD2588985.1 NADH-quinone oxidoreductase subunit M [Synechococcus elongatus FACHB-242]MBD2690051.1 NADH-quinone oxidoreductase subunit M [Syne